MQAMAKDSRNSHTSVDVEKIHKGKVATLPACRLCVELVSGGSFCQNQSIIRLCAIVISASTGLFITNVILFLSHLCHSNGPKNTISKCEPPAIRTSPRRHTFIGRWRYRRYRCSSSRSSTIALASLNQRTNGQSVRRRKILSLHSHTVKVRNLELRCAIRQR